MDINNIVIMVVSGFLGYFIVKHFQMKAEIAKYDLDREHDMIYRSIEDVRDNIENYIEKVNTKIKNTQNDIYSEMDNRFRSFATAINDAERRIEEIETKNIISKEPTLFDNVP